MATSNIPTPSENRAHYWLRVLRPLLWWFLLVLVLYGIRTHQLLMEKTRLIFSVTVNGRADYSEPSITLDGNPTVSDQIIALGRHQFVIRHPKGEIFTTNLFIWYGRHDLGAINLKRAKGTLALQVIPPAAVVTIRGSEFSQTLTNSAGLTVSVPTDVYAIEAISAHWRQQTEVSVSDGSTISGRIAPSLGAVVLTCNQTNASFELLNPEDRLVETGEFPARISELPSGSYKLVAQHHDHRLEKNVDVKAGAPTELPCEFSYGTVVLETVPPGASVRSGDSGNLGETPLKLDEVTTGTWSFTLHRNGYEVALAALEITANQTTIFRTNLVSLNYTALMRAARQYMAEQNYERAAAAVNEALSAKPGDAEALALQPQADGAWRIQLGKAKGRQGDYTGGIADLTKALELLPDHQEAKRLLADYQKREPEQIRTKEIAARRNRPKEELLKLLADVKGADLFEFQEIRCNMDVALLAANMPAALPGPMRKLVIASQKSVSPEVTTLVIKQGGMQSAMICCLVIGRVAEDETQVLFKIVEFANNSPTKDTLMSMFAGPGTRDYELLQPVGGGWTSAQHAQIQESIEAIRQMVFRAMQPNRGK